MKDQLKIYFFNSIPNVFKCIIFIITGHSDIINKLSERYSRDSIDRFLHIFHSKNKFFFKRMDILYIDFEITFPKIIQYLKNELSKFYKIDESEYTFDDILEKFEKYFDMRKFLSHDMKTNTIKYLESTYLDENYLKLTPYEGINGNDLFTLKHMNPDGTVDQTYSSRYIKHHYDRIEKIFNNIPITLDYFNIYDVCVEPKGYHSDFKILMKNDDYKKGTIILDFKISTNFKNKLLELIDEYNVEESIQDFILTFCE